MNKETIQGKFDQTAGAIKQKVGEATGNQKLANSGVADQIKGAAKETWGKTKDVAEQAAVQGNTQKESLTQRMEEAAHNMRERLAESAENAKNRVNEKLEEIRDRNDKA